MTQQQNTKSTWTDIGPNEWIPEDEVPEKATELATTVDDWFSEYREFIDPFNWEEAEKQYFRKKAFLEVSCYLLNALGVAGERPLPEIHDLIIDRVNDRRFGELMLRSSHELHHFYPPFIYAGYVDEIDPKTVNRLEKAIDHGAFWDAERVQYRQQEYCFMFKLFSAVFGFTQDVYDAEAALENSLLENQPNVVRGYLTDSYCLTHDVIFYKNHFGACSEAFPDEPAPYDISALLRGLILRYMAEDNCDIVLELVLAGILQRQISRQMVQLVLSWVWEKVDGREYVPGPDPGKTAIANLPEIDDTSLELDHGDEDKWDYETEREEVWGENFHTNAVAGMTARFIARDWDELEQRPSDHSMADRSYRRDVTRLGQVLHSLSKYDLHDAARQLKALADSPVLTEFEEATRDAVSYLEDQRTLDGDFGYWTREEILYTNAGNSPESFQTDLVDPISEACEAALDAVDTATNPSS